MAKAVETFSWTQMRSTKPLGSEVLTRLTNSEL